MSGSLVIHNALKATPEEIAQADIIPDEIAYSATVGQMAQDAGNGSSMA